MPKIWKIAASELHDTRTVDTLPLAHVMPAIAGLESAQAIALNRVQGSLETAGNTANVIAPALPHTASPSLKGAVLVWLQTITRALNADCRTDRMCLLSNQDAHERVHALLHVLRL